LHNFSIHIAGVAIDIESPLSPGELGLENRFGTFHHSQEEPDLRSALRWEESASLPVPEGKVIYDPGSIWRMYRTGEGYCAEIGYPREDAQEPARGLLWANAVWGDLALREKRTGAAWQSLLNIGAGELAFRTRILFADGLVFHAAGIDDNGRGIVFVGHSGAGKSTQLGLWEDLPGVTAMNDDRIAVRSTPKGVACYGTPWGGSRDIARNHRAPLAAIVLLEQAAENEIQRLPAAMAASLLMARTFLPYWDQGLMVRAMNNLNEILKRAPVYRLRCRPEAAVVPLVRSVL
jgi:hypothetical protein